MQQKAVLMVWDNFESVLPQFNTTAAGGGTPYTDEERRLLAVLFHDLTNGPGKGCVFVTSRPGETGLPGALNFELQGLARADSLWLLRASSSAPTSSSATPAFPETSSTPCSAISQTIPFRSSWSARTSVPSLPSRSAPTSASWSSR